MSTVLCSAHITICDILRNPIRTHRCRISTGSWPDAMLVWGHAAEEILVPVCVAMGSYENPDRLTRLTKLFAKKSAGCFDGAQNCHFDCIDSKMQLWSHRTTNAVRDHPGLALGKPGSRLIQFLIDKHFLCTFSTAHDAHPLCQKPWTAQLYRLLDTSWWQCLQCEPHRYPSLQILNG